MGWGRKLANIKPTERTPSGVAFMVWLTRTPTVKPLLSYVHWLIESKINYRYKVFKTAGSKCKYKEKQEPSERTPSGIDWTGQCVMVSVMPTAMVINSLRGHALLCPLMVTVSSFNFR